jgi:hypothetical protein
MNKIETLLKEDVFAKTRYYAVSEEDSGVATVFVEKEIDINGLRSTIKIDISGFISFVDDEILNCDVWGGLDEIVNKQHGGDPFEQRVQSMRDDIADEKRKDR